MQKQELEAFLKTAAERIALSENNIAEQELLKSEQLLINKIRIFLLVECENKRNHTPILFSDFFEKTHLGDLHSNIMSTDTGRKCALWLDNQVGNNETFRKTYIKDIPLHRLMYLDKRYYDSEELLSFMMSQQDQGKPLFENPECRSRFPFSKTTKHKLFEHPTTQAYLLENANERFNVSMIPEDFFNLLHEYLCKLHLLGTQNNRWSFNNLEPKCNNLRAEFIEKVNTNMTSDIISILDQIKIHVPLRNGQDTENLLYTRALKNPSCVISQQIHLWAFLQEKRPDIQIPEKVYSDPRAQQYQLAPNQQSSQQDSRPINRLITDFSLQSHPDFFMANVDWSQINSNLQRIEGSPEFNRESPPSLRTPTLSQGYGMFRPSLAPTTPQTISARRESPPLRFNTNLPR